jgi:hypothetical protein
MRYLVNFITFWMTMTFVAAFLEYVVGNDRVSAMTGGEIFCLFSAASLLQGIFNALFKSNEIPSR